MTLAWEKGGSLTLGVRLILIPIVRDVGVASVNQRQKVTLIVLTCVVVHQLEPHVDVSRIYK